MVTRRLVLQASTLPFAAQGQPAATLKFVFSRPHDNPRTQWLIRVYRDVCALSDLGFDYIDVPPKRATAMVLAGQADGELGRTFAFQDFFPALVRLSEPNNTQSISALTAPVRRPAFPASTSCGNRLCAANPGVASTNWKRCLQPMWTTTTGH